MVAIIDNNTVAAIGLRTLLQSIMPNATIDVYGSFAELSANHPERYFHYFVDVNMALTHLEFFNGNRRKTIVLTPSVNPDSTLQGFRTLYTDLPETHIVRALLAMEQYAHADGRHLPAEIAMPEPVNGKPNGGSVLSNREIEVLVLVVKGCINKEIAERLNIVVATVVTHRRNITEKLGRKSIGALTIYAVMHGYVSVNDI